MMNQGEIINLTYTIAVTAATIFSQQLGVECNTMWSTSMKKIYENYHYACKKSLAAAATVLYLKSKLPTETILRTSSFHHVAATRLETKSFLHARVGLTKLEASNMWLQGY